jgi:hypothetical protein
VNENEKGKRRLEEATDKREEEGYSREIHIIGEIYSDIFML